MKKISALSWCIVVFFVNLFTWILYVVCNVLQLNVKGVGDLIMQNLMVYFLYVHSIVLGIIYVKYDRKFCDIFNMSQVKSVISTIIAWIISSISIGFTVLMLNYGDVIPAVGDYFSGFEYVFLMFTLSVEFVLVVGVGKVITRSKSIELEKNSDIEDESKNME